jgi:hemerythrin-like domain-containing protein
MKESPEFMIQIGAPLANDFSNPLGVLSDCHRRVEHFLHLLITVTAQARGGALSAEQRDALEVALRYFDEAAPKHTDDEEESLFPRLRASRHPQAPEALAIVDALAQDHEVAQRHHAQVATLAHRWLTHGSLPAAAARELATRLDALAVLYRRHISVEDGELIPLARGILDAADIAAFGREMAARRGIDPTRWPYRTAAAAGTPHRVHADRQPTDSSR